EAVIFFQLGLQRGERFDDAHQVLVRADSAGVQQEWIVHLVALLDKVLIGTGRMTVLKALIHSVVDDFHVIGRDSEELLQFALGESGDSDDAGGPGQNSAREMKMDRPPEPALFAGT